MSRILSVRGLRGLGRGVGSGRVLAAGAVLADGLDAQASGRFAEALDAFRAVQKAPSPLLKALACNAESLLLLRGLPNAALAATMPLQDFKPGDLVLAPWAEDGCDYAATVGSVDEVAGHCDVDWLDGVLAHQRVPLASLTTLEKTVSASSARDRPGEVRLWAARRALRKALDEWQAQAHWGYAHDAFVDVAGLLCDAALAEARVALASPQHCFKEAGLGLARKHLQRARWIAERAWAPDRRALAAICAARAEILRLCAADSAAVLHTQDVDKDLPDENVVRALAAASATGHSLGGETSLEGIDASAVTEARVVMGSGSKTGTPGDLLMEALELHHRAAEHLRTCAWHKAQGTGVWRPDIRAEAIHELLWAKALAQAAWRDPKRGRLTRRQRSQTSDEKAPKNLAVAAASWSLPEKLVPFQEATVARPCHEAQAAVVKAWQSLRLAAGEPRKKEWPSEKEAQRLALRLEPGAASRLLLEVAVLIFAMGCKMGRSGWARAVASPLAAAAAQHLGAGAVDDAGLAALVALQAIRGHGPRDLRSRPSLLQSVADELPVCLRSRCRLIGYRPWEEVWIIRMSAGRVVQVPGNAPLTWCLEGLALSETLPNLRSESE